MRRGYLNDTIFFWFPKHVVLKRGNMYVEPFGTCVPDHDNLPF